MKVGIIGAGKVGTAFSLFLMDRGVQLAGFSSRTYVSAQKAAALANTTAYESPLELICEADLIFLTVVDDQIEPLATWLAASLQKAMPESWEKVQLPIFVHMSGAHSAASLAPLALAGYETATLHPLQSISEVQLARQAFPGTLFCAETTAGSRFETWLLETGIRHVKISSDYKALYHAGAVFASNYLVTLLDAAVNLLMKAGFTISEATEGLMPLVQGSLENFRQLGAENALTGPIARGDVKTVQRHLETLKSLAALDALYRAMAVATLELALRQKLKAQPGAAEALTALFVKEDVQREG